jgi:hypothetical protein
MNSEEDQLPAESDFLDSRFRDLDERHAVKMFLGKTPAQAEEMFRHSFISYYEDLLSMRATAFRFYVIPAIRYLTGEAASGDPDAVSTFCYLLEERFKNDPEALKPIVPILLNTIQKILNGFARYDCASDIYGDVPSRYHKLAQQLIA